MSGQGLQYYVDVVMCIDCTGSMGDLLNTVKTNALKFYPDIKAECEKSGREISQLRIRVIAFRDFEADGSAAIDDTGFLLIPDQEEKFKAYVSGLNAMGGGDEPENGLEALAMAINSDWTTGGDRRRQIIVVWTDASTKPLGTCKASSYPGNMPASFDELTDWWEDEQAGKVNSNAKRLILFAPDASAWTEIGLDWNKTIHHPAKAGAGLSDVDYNTILQMIVRTIQ